MSKYKFLAEFPAEVTRYVKLENCENGKIENCLITPICGTQIKRDLSLCESARTMTARYFCLA